MIGEWQPGATLGNASADVLGGRRLVFLSGSGEQEITSHGAGILDLTDDGLRMFLNAINHMAEPRLFLDPPVMVGDTITINWRNGGTLETATDLDGVWTSTGNATGTYTSDIGEVMLFYRVIAE